MSSEFYEGKDFPEEINRAQSRFSVDVLVYLPCLDEHTVGWFDFNTMKWLFLSNQDYRGRRFVWRYFDNILDKRIFKDE